MHLYICVIALFITTRSILNWVHYFQAEYLCPYAVQGKPGVTSIIHISECGTMALYIFLHAWPGLGQHLNTHWVQGEEWEVP